MFSVYSRLPQDSQEAQHPPPRTFSWRNLTTALLIFTNLILLTALFYSDHHRNNAVEPPPPSNYALTDSISTIWTQFRWNTKYSPKNHSEADALWDAINPAHGIIAVDRQWAAEQQWPVSIDLPSDKSKSVYLLEAYHQLHCLRILRKTFWEAVEQRPFTYKPIDHMNHCFDALLQSAVCNADNTPLYSFGDFTAGDGQVHKCKSWDELRDFATKHTACYKDSIERIPLEDHFGFCDDGTDGLIIP